MDADPFAALPPPHAASRATVVIPAHNEAEYVTRTLAALVAQCDVDGAPLEANTFDVIVYANNCDDGTASMARRFAGRSGGPQIYVAEERLPPNVAHIGTARRAAMNVASARLTAAGITQGILVATDADTVVAPTWLAWTLREMEHADAVTGRILVDPTDWKVLPPKIRRMLDEENAYLYAVAQLESLLAPKPYDPWPRHWQRSGPSFAVRVAAYDAAGGVPPVRALEDIALYDALERTGARIRHSLRVRVWTSARLQARAPGGFGDRISTWNDLNAAGDVPLLVEDPDVTFDRFLRVVDAAAGHRLMVPIVDATVALRQLIERGASDERATRSSVASIAG